MSQKNVFAAGGVIVRDSGSGTLEFCLVHRPQYDDWTFPKGRVENGESIDETAHREILEEAGITAAIVPGVSVQTNYFDQQGRDKYVTYFLMRFTNQDFHPNNEVDIHMWLSETEANSKLSFDRDREVLKTMVDHLIGNR